MSTQQLETVVATGEQTPQPKAAKSERLLSLDVFRGFTLLSMVLVNSHPGPIYPPIAHASWHGWTFTDLIFPFFVFIVGVAIPYSFANRLARGESKGQLLLDGRNAELAAAIGPTIFVDVDPNASLSREEIFGPVLVVTRFTSEEQALQLANDSQYGLGAAVWTRDLSRAHRMSRRLKAGSVFVNNYNDGDMTVPFGGYKQSGNGRDKSLHALEKFTELKTIWISLEA